MRNKINVMKSIFSFLFFIGFVNTYFSAEEINDDTEINNTSSALTLVTRELKIATPQISDDITCNQQIFLKISELTTNLFRCIYNFASENGGDIASRTTGAFLAWKIFNSIH